MIYDCLFYFNRRSRKGSDHVKKTDYPHRPCISIRAPTRGATFCRGLCYQCCADFNPRSHEGSDEFVIKQVEPSGISLRAPTRGATFMPEVMP